MEKPADSSPVVEFFVRLYVFLLAAVYAVKELLFEARNQGVARRLNAEIQCSQIVNQQLKTAMVTGADGTIGSEVVKRLLKLGFKVHAIVKDRKANPNLTELSKMYDTLEIYDLDFEDPFKVVHFTDDFRNRGGVHLVILSAGIMLAPEKYIEEIESHLCVNVVSQALLLDGLKNNFTPETRIVALSSTCARAAYKHGSYDKDSLFLRYMGPYQAYAMSKLVLSAYATELAKNEGLQVVSMHPGVVPGRLYRNVNIFLKIVTYFILPYFMRSPKFSAHLVVHTALRADFLPGAYYEDCEVKSVPHRLTEAQRNEVYSSIKACIQSLRE